MNYSTVTNPVFSNAENTLITATVNFDEIGEHQFGASPTDSEAHGREIFARCIAGEFDSIAPYVAPQAQAPQSISMRQARRALLAAGLLATVNAGISAMPEADQIEWEFATTVQRASPLVATLASALGLDDATLDALFTQGALL